MRIITHSRQRVEQMFCQIMAPAKERIGSLYGDPIRKLVPWQVLVVDEMEVVKEYIASSIFIGE